MCTRAILLQNRRPLRSCVPQLEVLECTETNLRLVPPTQQCIVAILPPDFIFMIPSFS